MTDRFTQALARGALVLDAAMGTRLIARGLDLSHDDPVFWNHSHPEMIRDLHKSDVLAGADALLTNTFGANRAWLARWGRADEVETINRRAVSLARESIGERGIVIGSVGPTAASNVGAYREQAEVLADAGVDAILLETHRAESAANALQEVQSVGRVPMFVSLVDWPDPVRDTAHRLSDLGATVLGANCQLGMAATLAMIERLKAATDLPLLAKPSAGLPNTRLEAPESFARAVPRLLAAGVRLVGGCCGTNEAHVAALRKACYDRNVRTEADEGPTP